MTNVLVEGGARLFGALLDLRAIDEVHAFIAPKLLGGAEAVSPVGGSGVERMTEAVGLFDCQVTTVGADIYIRGRVER
jgi:diaminohydroxyphosphoribosylaminopyrimidine deaminase/5-amino-6-(5-phosphoribosylamino)uracil reductase